MDGSREDIIMRYPLTDEQSEQALSALLDCFTSFDHNNPKHTRWLEERYQRATAGIYPYYPLESSHPILRENLGLDPAEPRIMMHNTSKESINEAAYAAWVYYGDLRSSYRFQSFLANRKGGSTSEATCYMQHVVDRYIARHVRQGRARNASEINAFINQIYRRHSTRNNARPTVCLSAKGLYHHEVEGAFCPIEESGEPTLLQNCGYCGTKTASLVLRPEAMHHWSPSYYGPSSGLYPESWDQFKEDWGVLTVCDNELCQEIEQHASRGHQHRRIASLVNEPMRAANIATLERVPEEYRPALKAARYVDFVARVEQRVNKLNA